MMQAPHGLPPHLRDGVMPSRNGLPIDPPAAQRAQFERRAGILRIGIGSSHIVADMPGQREARGQYSTRDRRKHDKAAAVWCCAARVCRGKKWLSFGALVADHPSAEAMAETGEAHPVGLWSADPAAPEERAPLLAAVKAAEEDVEGLAALLALALKDRAASKGAALLEAAKLCVATRAELEEATARLAMARARSDAAAIIGLLSPDVE